jgi:signal transduction histidine kinase
MVEWVGWWFDSRNYMPHGHCYLWQPAVLWLNVGSDLAIGAAYMTIPAVIGRFARQRAREVRFGWISLLFASFIFLCGMTHFFEVWTAWYPTYRLSGLVKAATAMVSVSTAITLVYIMPGVLTLRTPIQLEAVVAERTRELEEANRRLHEEIIARRESERALEESQRLLRLSDQRKDEFLATLSHELRNPLAPIRNGLALFDTLHHPDPLFARTRSMMQRQVTQMVRLIDDLLDISRISTGRFALHPEPMVLQGAIAAAIEATQPLLDEARHRLEVELPERPLLLHGDATRLSQVFANLLSNSAKYMSPGGHVRVRAWRERWGDAEVARVEVVDQGIGIAEADMPHLFDMFTQVETAASHRQNGLGIGLALSRRFVELHRGHIDVHSEGPGRGSRFTVLLPIQPERPPGPPR